VGALYTIISSAKLNSKFRKKVEIKMAGDFLQNSEFRMSLQLFCVPPE
jgi:hypothetical protein